MTVSSCYRCYHLPPVGELNCPRILENLLRSFEIAFNFFSMAFTLRMPPCTSLHFIPLPFFFLSFLTLFSSLPATQTYSNSPPLLLSSPSDMQVKTFPAADAAGFSETTSAGWSYCISLACSSLAGFLPSSSSSTFLLSGTVRGLLEATLVKASLWAVQVTAIGCRGLNLKVETVLKVLPILVTCSCT